MADNVAITAGAGTSIKTDQVGSDHYQYVKLADGTVDSGTAIAAGGGVEAAALRVTLASDSTGVVSVDDNGATISVDDGGGALTVDGTVTANAGTNLNTSALALEAGGNLATIAGDTTSLDGKVTACNTGAVVLSSGTVTTVSTVTNLAQMGGAALNMGEGTIGTGTQRVTLATDDDGVSHLATIAGDTTSLDGKVTACNTGAVVLAAGSAAIGTLAANSGVDIGDVDVTSIVPGTAAANLGKAEDAEHTSGDVGVMALSVRSDAGGTLAGADGDYAPLQVDANGALRVTGGGGGTEYTEDVATADPIVGTATMMERDDALGGLTPAEGDWASLRCDANGALWVHDNVVNTLLGTIDADTSTIAGDTTSIDGKITACNTGAVVVASGAITETNSASLAVVGGGAEATALRVTLANDSTGVVTVDGTVTANLSATDNAVLDVIAADTTSLDGKVTACNTGAVVISSGSCTVDLGANNDVVVAGDVATDAADSGNPVKVGGKAVNMDSTVPGTAVAEADRTDFISDVYGRQCVETSHPNFWSATANYGAAQTDTELKATPGAGLSLYITDVIISNGPTAGNVKLVEDTASAVDILEVMYFAANGGTVLSLKTPIKLTANKNLGVTSVSSTDHSVTVSGYIAP